MGLDTYQKINDGNLGLAIICPMTVQSQGMVAKGMVEFYPKVTWQWRLIIGGNFHLLSPGGLPIVPNGVFDDGHHTTHSGWIGAWLPPGHGMPDGTTTWLVSDWDGLFSIDAT